MKTIREIVYDTLHNEYCNSFNIDLLMKQIKQREKQRVGQHGQRGCQRVGQHGQRVGQHGQRVGLRVGLYRLAVSQHH